MLEKLGFDSPESVKRFIMTLVAPLLALLNAKYGWGIPDMVLSAVIGAIAAFVWQSGHKSAAVASVPMSAADRIALARPQEDLK